ncbi:hypothetical protein JCM8547_007352 [Rhodosporidiobolus lusitaniae]
MSVAYSGTCLCKASKVTITGPKVDSQIRCHCIDCNLTSGTAFSSNILVKESDVQMDGAIGSYAIKGASGNPVTRYFCSKCASHFGHNSVVFGDQMAIQTGVLVQDFKHIPYSLELFAKDRWAGVEPVKGGEPEAPTKARL